MQQRTSIISPRPAPIPGTYLQTRPSGESLVNLQVEAIGSLAPPMQLEIKLDTTSMINIIGAMQVIHQALRFHRNQVLTGRN